ncbi:DUF2946 family protein [Brevundimonas sp. R86498]|uniref:DUF2946 family protein n=1 Tax=Brevundimonas sp. R86498 TaxID=3093845 RepID=UPI0037C75C09
MRKRARGGDFAALSLARGLRYRRAVTRHPTESWSTLRSLAFLAATFAIVFGSLMPFAALAASTPGHPMVICSTEGPQTIAIGVDGEHGSGKGMAGAKCAACVLAFAAALPAPPVLQPAAGATTRPASVFVVQHEAAPPPARGPPRPPSTAPPKA